MTQADLTLEQPLEKPIMSTRPYPLSFHPEALWNAEEICGYLSISIAYFYQIEKYFDSFKIGQRRVAYAKDVMRYAEQVKQKQNPLSGVRR